MISMWKGDLDKVKEMKKCSQVELLKNWFSEFPKGVKPKTFQNTG